MALGTASSIAAQRRCAGLDAWCVSPRRSVSAASRNCRKCSARICATAGPTIPNGSRRCTRSARDSGDPTRLLVGFANSAAASIARLREADAAAPISTGRSASSPAPRRSIASASGVRSASPTISTYALAQLGVPARLIDNVGGLAPEQLARAGAGDALIAISFSPYSPFTLDFAKRAQAKRRADRRRHRQRAVAARRPRRRPLRDRRKRLRLVSLARRDFLSRDDARGRRGGAADGNRRRLAPSKKRLHRLLTGSPI